MAALITARTSSLMPSGWPAAGGAGAAGAGAGAGAGAFTPAAASSAATRSASRLTSARRAARVPSRPPGFAVSGFMTCSSPPCLERDQAVLLGRPLVALGLQVLQRLSQVAP